MAIPFGSAFSPARGDQDTTTITTCLTGLVNHLYRRYFFKGAWIVNSGFGRAVSL